MRVRRQSTAGTKSGTSKSRSGKSVKSSNPTPSPASLSRFNKKMLLQTSKHLEGIIRSTMDGVIMINGEQNVTLCNKAAERMFGISESDMFGRPIDGLIPELFRDRHRGHVEKSERTSGSANKGGRVGEVYGVRATGEAFPIETTIAQSIVEGERVFAVIFRDVSQRREKMELERQLGTVLEESRHEIYVFDERTLKFLQVNRGARENLGFSLKELRTMTPLDLEPQVSPPTFSKQLQCLRTGVADSVQFQTVHKRRNGSLYPVDVHIHLSSWGNHKAFLALILDLSERLESKKVLQHERDFNTAILNTVGALIVILDPHGAILRFNRACEVATGYRADEVRGKRIWDFLIDTEEMRVVQQVFEQLREGQIANQFENDWVTKGGEHRRVTWTNTVLFSERGEVEYIIATGIDITDFKKVQEDLQLAERLAELGIVASGMAHEIGTPMNVILGRAEYLLNKTEEEQTRKGLQTIVAQVERITKIMNQLLAFARRRKAEFRQTDLQKIIEECLEVLLERLDRIGIKVQLSFHATPFRIQADPDHMTQVFLNLFINAIQAMPDGGTLCVELLRKNQHVIVRISDSGIGIPPEHLPKIFLPFFTTKGTERGTGLGLSVVKDIIQEHRGTMDVESTLGEGTVFTIAFPCSEERREDGGSIQF